MEELYEIHLRRAEHILQIAASRDVDVLVLGAFGCGAFANDPDIVAKAYHDALSSCREWFDVIEFAIYCRSHETENYQAFQRRLGEYVRETL